MSNYKPYFRYLRDMNMKMMLIFVVILCINTFTFIVGTVQSADFQNDVINFSSQCSVVGGMICIGIGFFYSLSLFASTMCIKADRIGCLKAMFLWGVILSVGLGLFSYGFDMLCKVILEVLTKMPVKIYSDILWIDMEILEVLTRIFNRMIGNMALFSLGFVVGAIWYRLKVRTSILIFVILPVIFTAYGVNFGIKNPDKMNLIFVKIRNILAILFENPVLFNSIKFFGIVVFSVAGIMLLIKGPIKEYANDLL